MSQETSRAETSTVGRLIQHWRRARKKSQLTLALDAGVSARHLGFLEVGRAKPSREMVLLLAGVLDVPLRERNGLLLAAGYAPIYRETGLDAPEMEHARKAVGMISLPSGGPPANIIRLMFDPAGLRPYVANWESVAEALVHRVHREALGGVPDPETVALLKEVLNYPGVPGRWRSPDLLAPFPKPYLPVQFRKGDLARDFFSTVTTLGTPLDVTLQEIRIECFFPADEQTAARVHAHERSGGASV